MSKFGSDLFAKDIHADKIHWKEFVPPLSEDPGGGGPPVPTLAAVLAAGSDANFVDQINLGDMTGTGDITTAGTINSYKPAVMGPGIQCQQLEIFNSIIPSVSGQGTIGTFNQIESNQLSANDTLEARAATTHLGRVLQYSTEPTPRLSAEIIDGTVKCKALTVSDPYSDAVPQTIISEIGGQGVVATTGLVQAGVGVTTNTVQANTQITFGTAATLDGFSSTNRTVCTNLDLTSATNTFSDETERYEWLTVWTDATTNFPPADGWKPYTPPDLPSIRLVYFDFWNHRANLSGWRYFAPQSDSDRQIDPDDKMGLHEGDYIHGPDNAAVWPYAFYGISAPTQIAAHSSQMVEFTFTSAQEGYGRIYIGLAFQSPPYTSEPVMNNSTFRLMMEHEGVALSTNPRINGPTTMKWYVPNSFPTDGTQVRIFPMVRVDDDVTTEGRLLIRIGNGQPLNGSNPGDPPEFTPTDTNAQQTQLILRGYPLPDTFFYFPNPLE